MGLQKTRDPKDLGSMYLERTTARVAASMVLGASKAEAPAAEAPRPSSSGLRPDLAADLATEMDGLRGPARFFYDKSSWPASYHYALAASLEERFERDECSSRSTSRAEDRSSTTTSSSECRSSVTSSSEEQSSQPKRVGRKQPRVCVMCDHCWKPVIPESRLYVLKCPKCLSDQPGDAELTGAELAAMALQCEKVTAEREAKAAARRKSRLAERSRLRMYDQPWTPQLANAYNRELALAHEED